MPDYKLAYILQNAPWEPLDLGVIDSPEETFYILGTGHEITDMDFRQNAVLFRRFISHDETTSVKEYLSYMFLNDMDPNAGTISDRRQVIDAGMAGMAEHPAVWTETAGDPLRTELNDRELVVPSQIAVYERVPFGGEVNTIDDLEMVLTQIAKQSVNITLD